MHTNEILVQKMDIYIYFFIYNDKDFLFLKDVKYPKACLVF